MNNCFYCGREMELPSYDDIGRPIACGDCFILEARADITPKGGIMTEQQARDIIQLLEKIVEIIRK